jgi:hypothetical protein
MPTSPLRVRPLQVYHFPQWDLHAQGYVRWSINFMAFKGSEMGRVTSSDDEEQISREFPQLWRRHCGAVGNTVASHFAYYPQRAALEAYTDLLEQYRNLTVNACGPLVPFES